MFVEAPRNLTRLKQIPKTCSCTVHGKYAGGGRDAFLDSAQLQDLGYKLVAYPLTLLSAGAAAIVEALSSLKAGREVERRMSFRGDEDAAGFCPLGEWVPISQTDGRGNLPNNEIVLFKPAFPCSWQSVTCRSVPRAAVMSSSRNCRVTGPGRPSPAGLPSIDTTGITKVVAEVMNASAASSASASETAAPRSVGYWFVPASENRLAGDPLRSRTPGCG